MSTMPEAATQWRPGHLRVVLIDDHAVVRAGYRRFLELEGIAVAKEWGHADQAYEALVLEPAPPADVFIIDLNLPGRGGLELTRHLLLRWREAKVLVFSMHEDSATVQQALRAGALGYVTKSSAPQVLVQAVQQVALGRRALSPDVQAFDVPLAFGLGALPGAVAQTGASAAAASLAPHAQLSAREYSVFLALVRGEPLENIATRLALSTKTVANYQTLIRQKLGVGNAVELLRYAQLHGLVA